MSATPRTFVVGSALGEESDRLVSTALALARSAGARLYVLHAFSPLIGLASDLGVGVADGDLLRLEEQRLRELLAEQLARLGCSPEDLAGSGVEVGAPHRCLPDLAARIGADLLIVGATSPGPHLPRLLGSTTERVVRKAACPVLVVRGELPVPPRRALAPVDLSPLSAEAFRRGLGLLAAFSGGTPCEVVALFVLSVLQRQVAPQFTPEQVDRFAAEELARFVAINAGDGAAVAPIAAIEQRVRTGNPREEILVELAEHPADLVVVGTHGLGGFDRLVIGSVAADVVREAPASVLVIPPDTRDQG